MSHIAATSTLCVFILKHISFAMCLLSSCSQFLTTKRRFGNDDIDTQDHCLSRPYPGDQPMTTSDGYNTDNEIYNFGLNASFEMKMHKCGLCPRQR